MTQPTASKHWKKPVGHWDRLQSYQNHSTVLQYELQATASRLIVIHISTKLHQFLIGSLTVPFLFPQSSVLHVPICSLYTTSTQDCSESTLTIPQPTQSHFHSIHREISSSECTEPNAQYNRESLSWQIRDAAMMSLQRPVARGTLPFSCCRDLDINHTTLKLEGGWPKIARC